MERRPGLLLLPLWLPPKTLRAFFMIAREGWFLCQLGLMVREMSHQGLVRDAR